MIIVGTHIDQISKYALPELTFKKRYPCIVGFHYVSSYDGTNVDALTQSIIDAALNEKYMGEKIPECWLQLESKLNEMSNFQKIIDLDDMKKYGMDCGIFDDTELTQAVQFLHDLGLSCFSLAFLFENTDQIFIIC